ncbi:MAG: gamma carbonic anhydrase family protein [Magnetococcales bacterium]|nr:gamma carbonic anhydrase family protein [Magnetococcales bacterium]MBF0150539.1 gamma carbonic anhydrase family protein [Magnetococcales bacterium]MBF0175070.1 gamma carbonic anhydrase family protein [Magnetococcales bacterium]MBF0346917.1 gamma carbonic anhydrase family protein [Magnetococcales bacterium]MBF0632980.1 gamma carbonic anhydrase family protein [Magnetococcales bacterium]
MAIYPFEGVFPQIHPQAFIHPEAVIIGRVRIGRLSSVWPGVIIRGDVNDIDIGEQTNIQDGCILHVTKGTPERPQGSSMTLGNRIIIGHKVTLHACHLMDDVMIGIGAIVLDRVVVHEKAMVGAGALVPPGKQIATRELWLGSPAKRVRERSDDELHSANRIMEHYTVLATQHRDSLIAHPIPIA